MIKTNDLLSRIYLSNREPKKALTLAMHNINLSQSMNLLSDLRNANLRASAAYEAIGNSAEALTYYKLFKQVNDWGVGCPAAVLQLL